MTHQIKLSLINEFLRLFYIKFFIKGAMQKCIGKSSYLVFKLNVIASDKTNLIVVSLTTREKRSKQLIVDFLSNSFTISLALQCSMLYSVHHLILNTYLFLTTCLSFGLGHKDDILFSIKASNSRLIVCLLSYFVIACVQQIGSYCVSILCKQ